MTQLSPDAPASRPFADSVADYALAGWPCVLPVPPREKTPPPTGFTGAEGRDTDPVTLATWAGSHATSSVALRMPEHVIGIDVDSYEKGGVRKHGAETFAAYLERWGPLPPTWTSTARGEGPSRIHFFRVPPGRYATRLATESTGDVEVIQRHHRYAVVWPSPHPGAGPDAVYRWYDPTGAVASRVPSPAELTELPPAWVAGLAAGASATSAASSDRASGEALLEQILDDWRPECADVTSARSQAAARLSKAEAGSRHDVMTERTHHLVQLAASGHPGAGRAIAEVRHLWETLTAGEDRAEELERALLTSARKAVTVVGPAQVPRDPCLLFGASTYASPAPGNDAPTPAGDESGDPAEVDPVEQPIEPARWWSVREQIGAHAFDPIAGLDQPLAEAVLERMWPILRHAYDSRGWLMRVPDRWELHGDLSQWAVATVASLMPTGDPEAEKGSDLLEQAKRRARFNTAAGSKAIASKMTALVTGGMHPAAIKLSALDAEPDVLWAGGMPWSLSHSIGGPTLATIDPSTPHLHSAGTTPEVRPTPLWDAFTAAVWPDPELRAWALRVLSICLTGYADRALPILMGETGRGKTQVVNLLMSVLGTYAHAADPRLLTPAGEMAHSSIVYALKGRRLSFIDEGPREGRVAQERLKQLTGGGELTANQMNQNPITFRPTHTLVLTTNDDPPLVDPAVRSRARLIPCEGDPESVRATRAAIGHLSGPAWRAEAPGVLAALMGQAAAWLAEPTSAGVAAAPDRIRYLAEVLGAGQDPVIVWLNEETEPWEEGTGSRELYQAFTASCLRNNLRRDAIPTETKWGRTLAQLGWPSVHHRSGKIRQLRIKQQGPGGVIPTPSPTAYMTGAPESRDGLVTGCDGLVANPSHANPQVNPSDSVIGDGLTGLQDPYVHVRTHTHAGEPDPENRSTRHAGDPQTAVDLRKQPGDGLGEPPSDQAPPRKKRERSPEAVAKAAETREAKRQAAVAAAGGPLLALPALVTRDLAVRSVSLPDATTLLSGLAELTVDVEHTGFPVGHTAYALRTVQLGIEQYALVLDPHEPAQRAIIRTALAAAPVLHAHSATADLVPLEEADLLEHGIDEAWSRMADTIVLAKLADPQLTGNGDGLKQLSAAMLGDYGLSKAADAERSALFKAGRWLTETKVTTPLERSGWGQVESTCTTMLRYAAADVLDDAALAARLPALPPELAERERLAQHMTARVAHRGLRIDGEHVQAMLDQHEPQRAMYAEQVRGYGIDNPGSDQQVGNVLTDLGAPLPRTATGKPSVAKGVLEPLAQHAGEGHPAAVLAEAVLDFRHHDTAIGTFLEPYRELVRNGDGRARPTVYTLGADTGRMSCVRPNLQQVPREGGFRACITADPGELLISADFSSVEIRVAAALSQDPVLLQLIAEGRDVHAEIARLVWGPDFNKADRYMAKRKVFGRIYGQGLDGMANTDGAGPEVARRVIDAMDSLTPGLSEWSRRIRSAIEAGSTQFPSYAGRVIHLPKGAPHAGPNYCIQGTARELLIDTLVRWRQTPWGEATLLPVHDEVVVKVPEDQADEATAALAACMTTELYGVPIAAEPSTPTFAWSDSV